MYQLHLIFFLHCLCNKGDTTEQLDDPSLKPEEHLMDESSKDFSGECSTGVDNEVKGARSGIGFFCHPQHWSHRFLALVLMLLANFGPCFIYDNPVSLESTIIEVRSCMHAWPLVVN